MRRVPASQIGLTDIFTDRANLSGISVEPVAVSKVIQKAEIEVDEDGATAAAATGTYIPILQHAACRRPNCKETPCSGTTY
jgi:serine protease inhibitor